MSTTTIVKIDIIQQPREYTPEGAYKAVLRGAVALSRHFSSTGWVDLVDLDTLHLFSPDRCILGQVFGSYGNGLLALRLNDETAVPHGFDTPLPSWDQFALLQQAWIDLVVDLGGGR